MTDDLVKRLRDSSRYDSRLLMREAAADRIEELEGAIRQIVFDAIQLARAALGEKKDGNV